MASILGPAHGQVNTPGWVPGRAREIRRARLGGYGRERFASFPVESGDPDAALAEIKEGMRMWPNNIFFHYLLGKALVKKTMRMAPSLNCNGS
jgi:hypothetical protein